MKERVLITGASGFVGFHLIDEALKNNLDVYAAVRKSSNVDHLKNLDITFIYLDFDDATSLRQEMILRKYDYIIHAAGITKARSQKEYNHINAGYTHNLAKAVLESGIKLKKLILISSLAAVGPLKTFTGIINEHTVPRPITSYGRSKLLAETRLTEFSSLDYSILRPTGVYGPRDRDIFIFFKQLTKKGIEPYIGKSPQKFSFIYGPDLAKVTIKALYLGQKKAYHLSDGNYYDRYELGNLIKEAMSLRSVKIHLPVRFVKLIAFISEKYSSLSNKAAVLNREKLKELMAVNWCCDTEPARIELGFYPEHNLKAGVAETLLWYKKHNWL
jgi:UDP-glucose 4-epimerase